MRFLRFLFRRTVTVLIASPPPVAPEPKYPKARPSETAPRKTTAVEPIARVNCQPARSTPFRYPDREERARRAQAFCARAKAGGGETLSGKCYIFDGDTIVINHIHIRLAGIDAPELDQPYGQSSKWALHKLCKGQVITARINGELSHNRLVATCHLPDGRDIAAELVRQGLALDWPLFSGGRYLQCEPPDARRKLWKTALRQKPGIAQSASA